MKKKSTQKLLSYSAIASAFLVSGQDADAQVVYTDIDPDSILISPVNSADSMDIDLDNDGNVDFQLKITSNIATTNSSIWKSAFLIPTGNNEIYNPASTYLGSAPIDEELMTNDLFAKNTQCLGIFYSTSSSYYIGGYLPGNGNVYTGVRFMSGSDTLYGWIRINVEEHVNNVTLLSYAYESQVGVGIHVGDTVGVYLDGLSISNLTGTSAQINYTPTKGGKVYCVVQDSANTKPSIGEIISGTGASGASIALADSNIAVEQTLAYFSVNGLNTGTEYTAYLVLVDDSNIVSHVKEISFPRGASSINDYNNVKLNVFPNPASSNLNLVLPETSVIIISDLNGKEIMRRDLQAGEQMINIETLASGSYIIKAINEKGIYTSNFIKE